MPVVTKPIRIPNKLEADRILIGFLQTVVDRVELPRVEDVEALSIVISDPPTQAEVAAIGNKVNEILAAFKAASVMDSE